jgi:hypothetical protein
MKGEVDGVSVFRTARCAHAMAQKMAKAAVAREECGCGPRASVWMELYDQMRAQVGCSHYVVAEWVGVEDFGGAGPDKWAPLLEGLFGRWAEGKAEDADEVS